MRNLSHYVSTPSALHKITTRAHHAVKCAPPFDIKIKTISTRIIVDRISASVASKQLGKRRDPEPHAQQLHRQRITRSIHKRPQAAALTANSTEFSHTNVTVKSLVQYWVSPSFATNGQRCISASLQTFCCQIYMCASILYMRLLSTEECNRQAE